MTELVINGSLIADKDALHDLMARELALPEWYGRNLDALFDCLTDLTEDLTISLIDATALEANLGRYGVGFQKMLKDAAAENPHIHVTIQ